MTTKDTPTKPLRKIDGTISLSPSLKKFAKPLIGSMMLMDFICVINRKITPFLTPLMIAAVFTLFFLMIGAQNRGFFKYQIPTHKKSQDPKVLFIIQAFLMSTLFSISFMTGYISDSACLVGYVFSFICSAIGFLIIGINYPEYRTDDCKISEDTFGDFHRSTNPASPKNLLSPTSIFKR